MPGSLSLRGSTLAGVDEPSGVPSLFRGNTKIIFTLPHGPAAQREFPPPVE